MDSSALHSDRMEVDDDLWAVNAFFEEKGWTDGLPIIPPTEERVAQMLTAVQRDPQDVVSALCRRAGRRPPSRKSPSTRSSASYLPCCRLDRGGGGFDRPEAESLRPPSDHGRTGDHVDRQRSDWKAAQHQQRFECSGRRLARQCYHRAVAFA